jgi:hypothetical protein
MTVEQKSSRADINKYTREMRKANAAFLDI